MNLLGQITISWAEGVIIYGPLGVGWIGMAYFINKLIELHKAREASMEVREGKRDTLIRDTMREQAEAYVKVSHKLENVYRGMVYMAATVGHNSIKKMAEDELARMDANRNG
jgi:hypothetical protein